MAEDTRSDADRGLADGAKPRVAVTRREALKLGAAAAVAASLGAVASAGAQSVIPAGNATRTFFTAAEHALVDELSEIIIPTDAQSPGARAARVAVYIDGQLAETWESQERTDWRTGLKLVDDLSRQMNGRAFMASTPAERLAVVTRIAANEAKPERPEEQFFGQLKARVVSAYYTSEIGIKQDIQYQGNTYLAEFVGQDVS